MKTVTLTVLLMLTLPGCTIFDAISGNMAKVVADGVDEYCSASDEQFRDEFRNQVTLASKKGHQIRVICAE